MKSPLLLLAAALALTTAASATRAWWTNCCTTPSARSSWTSTAPTYKSGPLPPQVYHRANLLEARVGTVHAEALAGDGMFPTQEGFAWQVGVGSRAHGVGYGGKSEWLVDFTGDGRVDQLNNRDGTREFWGMNGRSCGAGAGASDATFTAGLEQANH